MPRSSLHPKAFFSLVPANKQAEDVVNHPSNKHLVSLLNDGKAALNVGHAQSISGVNILATLRRTGDIRVEGARIARIQYSFEIDLDTKIIMFYDRSHSQTSQVFGDNATPFEHGRTRKVVVQKFLNSFIGMGGRERNAVRFELIWHCGSPDEIMKKTKDRENALEENPRLARTVDEADTILPSRRDTRLHTPGSLQLKLRHHLGNKLGSGEFGEVYQAVDVDSGKLMAVKKLKQPTAGQLDWAVSKREIKILSSISHPHIIDYITSHGWDKGQVEIFMGLKDGNIKTLIESE